VPRSYSLGKRADSVADTRRRIVDAALELYQEKSVSATTMLDVARRADVAPGTVANHFGSAEGLAAEVTAQILTDLQVPTPDLFDGVDDLGQRIRLLVGEISTFFERSKTWYQVSQREPPGAQVWRDAEARYYVEQDLLIRAALGPVAADADAVAVVSAVIGSYVLGAIEANGRSAEDAVDLVSDLITAWLATRHPGA
jgi:AcrR family transcriptional regulator